MARQVEQALLAAYSTRPCGTIHLFVAASFAFAVMVDRKLNVCGQVQCYDFDKAGGGYVPACLLPYATSQGLKGQVLPVGMRRRAFLPGFRSFCAGGVVWPG
jgi:hypothetical protein